MPQQRWPWAMPLKSSPARVPPRLGRVTKQISAQDTVSQKAHEYSEQVTQQAGAASHKAGEMKDTAADQLSHGYKKVAHKAQELKDSAA